ncbi:hypothetical protein BLOT_014359 [Blomia tropicalis]|nr:hypothetical protein BLOT_014359 [Blomia tropicalis]
MEEKMLNIFVAYKHLKKLTQSGAFFSLSHSYSHTHTHFMKGPHNRRSTTTTSSSSSGTPEKKRIKIYDIDLGIEIYCLFLCLYLMDDICGLCKHIFIIITSLLFYIFPFKQHKIHFKLIYFPYIFIYINFKPLTILTFSYINI